MGAPSWAIPYLNKVNNVQVDGFFWKDGMSYPIIGFEQYPSLQMVANNYSCYSNENDIYVSSNRTNNFYIIDLFNLQITSSNNVYSINQTVNRTSVRMPDAWGTTYAYLFYMDATSGTQKVAVPQGQTPPYTESINFSVSGTIQEIIEWVSKHFRNVNVYVDGEYWSGINVPAYTSNGGGATHIAKVTGQLKDLSSNLSDILMVSGGGGGGLLLGETEYTGKEAGGISGSGDNSADQSTGNAFGLGESGTNVSGGGSGLYGGYKGTSSKSGGAGSGYIGNSLLSNKKMVGYNVPTSSAESTKTESVNEVSTSAVSGKPKSGNGFARIKFLREPDYYWITQYTVDGTTYNLMQIGDVTIPDSIINATQMTCTAITGRGSTVPSFVTNLGDLIFDLQSSIDADVTLDFINNSFLRFLFGRYNYITSGTRMSGNQYYDVANSRVFRQGGWANFSDGKVKYYIAIKIDKVNHRAYMIVLEHSYAHWAGNIGYTAYAIGGMPNGVDLLYETFKDVR